MGDKSKKKNAEEKTIEKQSGGAVEYATFRFKCKEAKQLGSIGDVDTNKFFYFEGYGSAYGNVDSHGDIVEPGAFDESLRETDPTLLWIHDDTEPLGVFEEIKSDSSGLHVIGKMPKSDSLVSGRAIPQIEVGSMRMMSIGFVPREWYYEDGIRHLTKCFLPEISLLPKGSNKKATLNSFKSLNIEETKEIKTKREFEKVLKDSGAFSQKSAAYLASMVRDEFIEDSGDAGEPEVKISYEGETELKSFKNEMKEIASELRRL
jgi:HK97 family phage prohead protease